MAILHLLPFVNASVLHSADCRPHCAPMAVLKSSDEQTTKMYQQLLNLIEEMAIQASEQEGNETDLDESGLIASLVEDAEERGLPDDLIERLFRIVAVIRKKAREQ
jgi:hypothetical protein